MGIDRGNRRPTRYDKSSHLEYLISSGINGVKEVLHIGW